MKRVTNLVSHMGFYKGFKTDTKAAAVLRKNSPFYNKLLKPNEDVPFPPVSAVKEAKTVPVEGSTACVYNQACPNSRICIKGKLYAFHGKSVLVGILIGLLIR